VITEFADFQCPVCKRFSESWSLVKERFKDTVALVYIHFPLDNHPHALPAAKASECAGEQGRFAEFADVAYQQQDSLGKKSWFSIAAKAGVRDSSRFMACMSSSDVPERVRIGMKEGRALELRGTPTLFVNGWRFDGTLRSAALDTIIRQLLAGKRPSL
jgi:protein-disulfide isomerase